MFLIDSSIDLPQISFFTFFCSSQRKFLDFDDDIVLDVAVVAVIEEVLVVDAAVASAVVGYALLLLLLFLFL